MGSDWPQFPAEVMEIVVGVNTPAGEGVGTVQAEGEAVYYIIGWSCFWIFSLLK